MKAKRKPAGKGKTASDRMRKTVERPNVTRLYGKFERAFAVMTAQKTSSPAAEKAFERKVRNCSNLAWAITKAPAANIAEMLLKIKIAGWAIGVPHKNKLDNLDNWQAGGMMAPGEECYTLTSLRDDLRLLGTRAKLLRPDLVDFLTHTMQG